ncbi:hypothetical protein GLOIN_2v1700036 [Rhizophagus irregularis DAOM 181602=DAOM 197198]|nr:hypothetical protein GLOIN_2v1700036 [Rhizophagus irregularis DAOM 181602=DAOM 197198]
MKVAPLKMSEKEHCLNFVYLLDHPFFSGEKEYELILNCANVSSKKRPDLSCIMNGMPILNSEFKPLGYTSLQREKDRIKNSKISQSTITKQGRSRASDKASIFLILVSDLMESYFMDLEYDSLYRSWPFFTTKLVIDKTTIPLAGIAIHHLLALEVYDSFSLSEFTPTGQNSPNRLEIGCPILGRIW